MLNLSKPIHLYRSQRESRYPLRLWICEWQSIVLASVPGGVFLVEAGHHLDAQQTAKKILRDELVHALRFTFTIRPASTNETTLIKSAPAGTVLEAGISAAASSPRDKHFADGSSADSTSKT